MDYGCRNLSPSFLVSLILGLWWEPEEEPAHLMEDRKERNRELNGEDRERRGEGRRGGRKREERGHKWGRGNEKKRLRVCLGHTAPQRHLSRPCSSVRPYLADAFSCFDVI